MGLIQVFGCYNPWLGNDYCLTLPIWDWYIVKTDYCLWITGLHLTNMGLIHDVCYLCCYFHLLFPPKLHLTNMGLIQPARIEMQLVMYLSLHLTNMGLIRTIAPPLKIEYITPYQYGIDTFAIAKKCTFHTYHYLITPYQYGIDTIYRDPYCRLGLHNITPYQYGLNKKWPFLCRNGQKYKYQDVLKYFKWIKYIMLYK